MKKLLLSLMGCCMAFMANATIYVIGAGDGLNWDLPGKAYEAQADGTYKLEINNLTKFKFSTVRATAFDGDGGFNSGAYATGNTGFGSSVYPNGQTLPIVAWGEDQELPWTGNYTITIDLGKMTMTAKTSTPQPTEAPAVFIRGGMNGWGSPSQYQMTYNAASGSYSWTGQIAKGIEFKIADANWGSINYTTNSTSTLPDGKEVKLTYNGGNMGFAEDFNGTITLRIVNNTSHEAYGTFTQSGGGPVYPENMYVIGTVNGGAWNPTNGVKMTNEGDGIYTLDEVTFTENGGSTGFALTAALGTSDNDWNTVNALRFGPAVTDTPAVIGDNKADGIGDFSWSITPGTYSLSFDYNEKVLEIEKVGDDPVTPTPTIPETLYMLGDVNGLNWSTSQGLEAKGKDGVFSWTEVTMDNGNGKGYFNFATVLGADWNAVNGGNRYGAPATDTPLGVGGTGTIQLYAVNVDASNCQSWMVEAGKYNVEANLNTMVVKATRLEEPDNTITYQISGPIFMDNVTTMEMTLNGNIATATAEVQKQVFNIQKLVNGKVVETYGPTGAGDINDPGTYPGKVTNNSWVFNGVSIPDATREFSFSFNTETLVLTLTADEIVTPGPEPDPDMPEDAYVVYNNGVVNPQLHEYWWWNAVWDFKAANPAGSGEAFKFIASDGGTNASMGLNMEKPQNTGIFHNATLNFDWYAEAPATYVIKLTSVNDNEYRFTVDQSNTGKWNTVSLKVAEVFPIVAEEWNTDDNFGEGYVFSVALENGTDKSAIYFDRVYYSDVDYSWEAPEHVIPAPESVPVPTQPVADVVSVFSSEYPAATGFNLGYWGQATNVTDQEIGTSKVEYLRNFNYLGWELTNNINVSDFDYMHVDLWTAQEGVTFAFTPISEGPKEKLWNAPSVVAEQWNSYDVPLSYFAEGGVDLSKVFQIKYDKNNDNVAIYECYLANVYFWKEGGSVEPEAYHTIFNVEGETAGVQTLKVTNLENDETYTVANNTVNVTYDQNPTKFAISVSNAYRVQVSGPVELEYGVDYKLYSTEEFDGLYTAYLDLYAGASGPYPFTILVKKAEEPAVPATVTFSFTGVNSVSEIAEGLTLYNMFEFDDNGDYLKVNVDSNPFEYSYEGYSALIVEPAEGWNVTITCTDPEKYDKAFTLTPQYGGENEGEVTSYIFDIFGGCDGGEFIFALENVGGGDTNGVEGIEAEGESTYYTLQGVKVANPGHGIYIKVNNGKAEKVVL